jgi:hypothetical protein
LMVVVYVDDLLVVGRNEDQLADAMARTMGALAEDGWYTALDKTFITPCSAIVFLGLVVDLGERTLRVSKRLAKKLALLCKEVVRFQVVSLNVLQKVGGLLSFCAQAAPEAGIWRSAINGAMAEAQRLPGTMVGVKGCLQEELKLWAREAMHLPSLTKPQGGEQGDTVIVTDAAGDPYNGWGALAWPGKQAAPDIATLLGERRNYRAVGGWGQATGVQVMHGSLTAVTSSAAYELQGLHRALVALHRRDPAAVQGRRIVWYGDATSATRSIRGWRTRSAGSGVWVTNILQFCRRHKCRIDPHWVSRWLEWQPAADFLSRVEYKRGQAEWAMPEGVRQDIEKWAGWVPTVDLFAAEGNAGAAEACSRYPTKGMTTDAFSFPWDGIMGWAFPPFKMVSRVWAHLREAKGARVLVVVPVGSLVPSDLQVRVRALGDVALVRLDGVTASHPCPRGLKVIDVGPI